MRKIIAVILLFSSIAHAEGWRCEADGGSSEMKGNQFFACGVAVSKWEGVAREKARVLAQNEFVDLCNLSTDCWKKHRTIDPGRTECKKETHVFKCRRLLIFTMD